MPWGAAPALLSPRWHGALGNPDSLPTSGFQSHKERAKGSGSEVSSRPGEPCAAQPRGRPSRQRENRLCLPLVRERNVCFAV